MNPHKLQAAIDRATLKLTEKKLELYSRDKEAFYAVLDKMIIEELEDDKR